MPVELLCNCHILLHFFPRPHALALAGPQHFAAYPAYKTPSPAQNAALARGELRGRRAKLSYFFTFFLNDTIWYLCKLRKTLIFLQISLLA
jgi:hypothetical protein